MNKIKKPILVTESILPDEEEYSKFLHTIFKSHILTNQGEYAKRLEQELKDFLHVPSLNVCANGTLGLQLAIRLFGLEKKKIITTPFTYVATLSALLWENCEPIFADIDPQTLCIDPEHVAMKFKQHPDVAGIMAVHVYGNACDVERLGYIAKKNNLKIIYDAAHAFGSIYKGKSLLAYGDASVCSFHSTKLFHTVEGGCITTFNSEDSKKLELLRAFGHSGEDYQCLGINAKLSELHAAMGLSLLPGMMENLQRRAKLCSIYDQELEPCGDLIRHIHLTPGLTWNYAYYPLIFASNKMLMAVMEALSKEEIYPRRYFYPSLTKLPYVQKQSCPVAEDISERILCLPLWPGMEDEAPVQIAHIIVDTLKKEFL